ncbi:MAG: TolC family protein [Phycisphaerae bacterium]|nr:TolC family protein [Phycisphaerae bacterium]
MNLPIRRHRDCRAVARRPLICLLGSLALLAPSACTTAPGPTVAEAVPELAERVGAPLADHLPWDQPSAAWDGASPLSLDAALATALQNNRGLRRVLLEVEQRRARYQDSQLAPNPMVDIGGGIPLDMGTAPILAMIGTQVDWLWKREAMVGETDAALRASLFEAAAITVSTAVEVRAAYVGAAAAQELLALAQLDERTAARVMNALVLSFEQGEANAMLSNDARMAWSDALVRAMDAQQALLVAKARLLQAIGRGDVDMEWHTVATTTKAAIDECDLPVPPNPQDQAELTTLVRERRLDLRAAQARVDGATQRIALAKAGQWPSVNLGGGYDRGMEGGEAVMFVGQFSLPIFNQGQFRVAAAQVELEIARIDADALWQQALLDVWRARGALATQEHHAVQIRDVTLGALAANLRLLADGVEAGETAPVRLWQSERQETRVRAQLATARRDSMFAALAFEQALAGARLPAGAGMGGGAGAGAMGATGAGSAGSGGGMGGGSSGSGTTLELTAEEGMQ